jgi:hypothetical protein
VEKERKNSTKCSGGERRITVLHILEHKGGRAAENLVLAVADLQVCLR